MLSLLTIVLIQANSFSQAGRCCHLPLHDGRCPSRHGKMIGPVKCLVFPSQPSTKNSSLRAFRPSKSVQNGAHLPPNPSLNVRRLVSEGFTLAATPMIRLRPHVKGWAMLSNTLRNKILRNKILVSRNCCGVGRDRVWLYIVVQAEVLRAVSHQAILCERRIEA